MKNMLNLGCGNRFLTNWVNVDFRKRGEHVMAHNLLSGVPFPDNHFDVVYHSHVLEHFPKDKASFFIGECYRVLKPGGVLRVAVPDLEQNVRMYLQQLEKVTLDDNKLNQADYEWSVIEMLDQSVRNSSGGEMARYWRQPEMINEAHVKERVGNEFTAYRKSLGKVAENKATHKRASWRRYLRWSTYRDKLLTILSGDPELLEYVSVGRFRAGGEIHQWMYDRYSLNQLLLRAGFEKAQQVTAFESSIAGWPEYQSLDIQDGQVRKPDSLFMEAIK